MITRCDYMLHQPTASEAPKLQQVSCRPLLGDCVCVCVCVCVFVVAFLCSLFGAQVEMNMIAASFSNLGTRVVDMHHYMIQRHAQLVQPKHKATILPCKCIFNVSMVGLFCFLFCFCFVFF